jgi:hypothetical protein
MSEDLPVVPTRQKLAIEGRSRKGAVTGKLKHALELMVWEGTKRDAAATAAGFASSSLRFALRKPHVLAFYRAECDALRNSLKARNLHRLDTIADDSKNDMARVASIKALEQISDIADERRGKSGAGQLWFVQRRLFLRPDIAAVDRQRAFGIDADEDAGAGDVGGIIADGPMVEGGERLDFAEPFVHLIGQLVGAVTDEERRGDVLLATPLLAQGLEGAELVERMQRRTLDVLGQRVVLTENVGRGIADHAWNRRGLGQALLLHRQLERTVTPAASRDLEHAGLGALGVEDRPDVQALEQRASGDVLGQLLDRDAGLQPW